MSEQETPTTELGESLDLDTEAAVEIRERLNKEGFDAEGDTVLAELLDVLKLVIELRTAVAEPGLDTEELLDHVAALHDETDNAVKAYIQLLGTLDQQPDDQVND